MRFRAPDRSLDTFDFDFNKKLNRALIHELATGRFIAQREDALFLGPPGTGEEPSCSGHRPRRDPAGLSRPIVKRTHSSRNSPTPSAMGHARRTSPISRPLLIVDDLGMRRLPHTAAEDLDLRISSDQSLLENGADRIG